MIWRVREIGSLDGVIREEISEGVKTDFKLQRQAGDCHARHEERMLQGEGIGCTNNALGYA